MEKEVLQFIQEKTQELIQAESCCAEVKTAARVWLEAIGTENEETETERYINELKADIMPIDQLIVFADSEAGIKCFGKDTAKNIANHAEKIKAAGARFCDCPACAAAEAILKELKIL